MVRKISRIVRYLSIDGDWHTVEEVAEAVSQSIDQTFELLKKLSTFNFVEFDEYGRVRVESKLRKLFKR